VRKQVLPLIAVCVVASAHSFAHAGGSVAGATEYTQISNNLQLARGYVQQAQQTVNQINQYKTMLQNLQRMTPSALLGAAASALWKDKNMDKTFKDIRSIVVGGQNLALGLGNLDSTFRKLHPGYGGYGGSSNFNQLYAGWSDNTLSAVKNSLALISAHSDNFATEEKMVKELQDRSASATGQLEALQAGQDISLAMVGQLQQLRQLQMQQMQTQNAYLGSQQSQADVSNDAMQKFVNGVGRTRVRSAEEIEAGKR
jgi:P-type conjugative transfer protein TrbJ